MLSFVPLFRVCFGFYGHHTFRVYICVVPQEQGNAPIKIHIVNRAMINDYYILRNDNKCSADVYWWWHCFFIILSKQTKMIWQTQTIINFFFTSNLLAQVIKHVNIKKIRLHQLINQFDYFLTVTIIHLFTVWTIQCIYGKFCVLFDGYISRYYHGTDCHNVDFNLGVCIESLVVRREPCRPSGIGIFHWWNYRWPSICWVDIIKHINNIFRQPYYGYTPIDRKTFSKFLTYCPPNSSLVLDKRFYTLSKPSQNCRTILKTRNFLRVTVTIWPIG